MTQTLKTAMIKKLKTTIFTAKIMMNKEKEDYLEALRQTLKIWDRQGFSTSKASLWSEIETRTMTVRDIYENFYYSPSLNKNTLRGGVYSFLFESRENTLVLTSLLRKHIATMLNDHLGYLGISIDLAVVERDPNFLKDEVPKHLDSWRDTDKELLFNKLWEILEKLGFYNEEIRKAWAERLYGHK